MFLRRGLAPPAEVLNDVSKDVVTLFRILQRHYLPFMEMIRFGITSRAEFERLAATSPETLTDLERAARFLYLQRTAYGGKVSGRNFGVSVGLRGRFDVTRLGLVLEEIHARLAGGVIECLPWERFLARYDRPETLFYMDPPYWGSEGDYGPGVWERGDFGRLADALAGIQGRFLLSLNDTPEVRRIFGRFKQTKLKTTYVIGAGKGKKVSELLIEGP